MTPGEIFQDNLKSRVLDSRDNLKSDYFQQNNVVHKFIKFVSLFRVPEASARDVDKIWFAGVFGGKKSIYLARHHWGNECFGDKMHIVFSDSFRFKMSLSQLN